MSCVCDMARLQLQIYRLLQIISFQIDAAAQDMSTQDVANFVFASIRLRI